MPTHVRLVSFPWWTDPGEVGSRNPILGCAQRTAPAPLPFRLSTPYERINRAASGVAASPPMVTSASSVRETSREWSGTLPSEVDRCRRPRTRTTSRPPTSRLKVSWADLQLSKGEYAKLRFEERSRHDPTRSGKNKCPAKLGVEEQDRLVESTRGRPPPSSRREAAPAPDPMI